MFLAFAWGTASAQYCAGGPSSTFDSQIDLFEITGEMGTSIDTVVPCSSVGTGLTNLTAVDTAIVYRDSSYTISARAGSCGGSYTNRLTIYVDWNMNQVFEPAELIGYVNGLSGGASATQTFNLTVPSGISVGSTRMRVIQQETSAAGPSGPCDSYTWGSMNDYTITIAGPASSCPTPYALTAAGIGADNVDLQWTTTASTTQIAVVPADSVVQSSDFSAASGTSTNVSGLMGDTEYMAYAYDACGSDTATVAFRTLCNVFATPYSEDFDGGSFVAATNSQGTNGYLSTCWSTNLTGFAGTYPAWVVGEGTTPSGSSLTSSFSAGPIGDAGTGYGNYMFVEGSNYFYSGATGARLESPLIDLSSLTEPYLSFDAHLWDNYQSSSYTPKMSIEISNDNGMTWTSFPMKEGPFDDQSTKASPYSNVGIALSNYVNDTVKIAFVFKDFYYTNDLAIDNIEIDEDPACYAPIVGVDSLSYDWVTFNSLTYLGTSYYYTTANATATTSGSLTAYPDSVTNLSSDSTYSFYFYSDCATSNSDTVGPITLTPPTFNACGPTTVFPYVETFETSSAKKGCWTQEQVSGTKDWDLDADGSGSSFSASVSTPYEGSLWAEFTSSWTGGTTRLISPVMDMSAYATGEVTFAFANENWFGDQNELSVEYRLSPTDPWVEVWYSNDNETDWTTSSAVALATSSTMQFAFKGVDNYGKRIALDSVVFDQGPTCVKPIGLTAYDITSNQASVTWMGLTQSYSIDYGAVGTAALLSSVSNDTTTLSNLSPSTEYFVVVTADCGGGSFSDPSDTLFFTTACLPDSLGWSEGFDNATDPDDSFTPSTNYYGNYQEIPNSCWALSKTPTTFASATMYEPTGSYATNPLYATYAGVGYIYLYATSNQGIWLSTPRLHDMGSGLNQIRFHYRDRSSTFYGNMYVVAAMDQDGFSSANSVIYLDTLDYGTGGTDNWAERIVEIPSLPAGYEYIYFGKPDGSYSYLSLDEVYYEAQPTCKPATGADIVNISNSSADVNITSKAGGGNWQLEVVEPFYNSSTQALDFAQGTGTSSTISNGSGSLTGLTSDSYYGVYARQLCGAGDTSDWRGPFIFKTECDPSSTFPYVMEFESDWELEKGCWDTLSPGYTGFYKPGVHLYSGWSTSYTQTSRNLRFYASSSAPATVISRPMTIPSTGASVGFKYGAYDSNPSTVNNEFIVRIKEQGTANWDTLGVMSGSELVTSSSSFYDSYTVGNDEKQFMVPASLAGKDVVFGFDYVYNSWNGPSYFNIDSLYLGTPPACPDPDNGAQVAATASSVTIEWNSPLGQNKGSRIRWGTVAFTQATGAGMIGDTNAVLSPFTISGLSADSTYHVFVQDSCSVNDTTAWYGPFAVTTACDIATAPYITSFDAGMDGCWTNDGGSDVWKSTSVQNPAYGAQGFTDRTGNGGYAMWVDGSIPNDNSNPPVLTSRTVDITMLTQPELEFYVGSYNINNADSNILVVNIHDANGTTDSAVVFSGMSPDWQRVAVDLAGYTSPVSAEFIVYMDADATAPFYNDIIVDDISFNEKRNCFAASNTVISSIGSNSASIGWDVGSATGTDWVVTVTNSLNGVATVYSTTTNSLSLSGLSGGNGYCVTVSEICSATGDTTAPTAPVCFTTQCGVVYAPYIQEFAAYNYDFDCWSRSTNVNGQGTTTLWSGTYGDWMTGGVENVWGNTSGNSTWSSTLNNYAIGVDGSAPFSAVPVVTTPMIDVSALFKPQLKFHTISGQDGDTVVTWLGDTISNGQNTLVVDFYDGMSWHDSIHVDNRDTVAWDSVLIELNQFNISGPVQVRFSVHKTAVIPAFDDILLDNFAIEDDPAILTCTDIDTAYAFDINCADAMITWGTLDSNGVMTLGSSDTNRIGTVVYLGTDSVDMMANTKYYTTDTALYVDGLTPGVDYYFWAMDSCISGNTSKVIGSYMFTAATAPLPTMPTISVVNDTVDVTSDWTISLTGDSTVTYTWDVDGSSYTGMVINPTFTSNGTVTVSLNAANDCGSIDTTFTLTVTQIGVEELALDVANIYPNPSSGSFNVEFTSSENLDYRIELMDAMGRLVSFKEGRTSNVTEVRFDTDLPAGVYIVKTMVGEQMNIDRVTIRR